MKDHLTTINRTLGQLYSDGEAGNFVIYTVSEDKNYYVQASGEKNGDTIYIEAVSNNFIPPKFQLNQNKQNQLRSLGWISPEKGEGNFYKEWMVKSDQDRKEVADFIFKTLEQVYGLSASIDLNTELILQ